MNQGQLNRLWLTEGGGESLNAAGVTGLVGKVVYDSRVLQTMLVSYSDIKGKNLSTATYIRKRECVGVQWESWRSCGG